MQGHGTLQTAMEGTGSSREASGWHLKALEKHRRLPRVRPLPRLGREGCEGRMAQRGQGWEPCEGVQAARNDPRNHLVAALGSV